MILKEGASYHVKGWNFKAVFKLVGIDNVTKVATLETPKTKRITHAPLSKLFYTKRSRLKLKPIEVASGVVRAKRLTHINQSQIKTKTKEG